MKEFSIEQKAKAYDVAIKKAKSKIKDDKDHVLYEDDIIDLFPELAESENEKMKKVISDILLIDSDEIREILDTNNVLTQDIDAWLEKQNEQDNNEDLNILQRFSFYSYKDEPNILYLSGLYVNEKYRNKGVGTKILEVADEVANSLNCYAIRLKTKKGSNAERLYRTHGYNNLATEEKNEVWLEKQGEHKHTAEEVLIKAGLKPYKDGNQWCILLGDNIQEGICGFGNTIEDALYAFLKDLIASQGKQKSANKTEPKFKIGNWLVENEPNNYARFIQILEVVNAYGKERYKISRDLHNDEDIVECRFIENNYHSFTIQDAKDGDVLYMDNGLSTCTFIYKSINNVVIQKYASYNKFGFEGTSYIVLNDGYVCPATKEQCDTLMKAMAEAGYTFDFERKELKKIKQKLTEWSEEDIEMFGSISSTLSMYMYNTDIPSDIREIHKKEYAWFNELYNRVFSQPKQEWSEEDKVIRNALVKLVEMLYSYGSGIYDLDKKQFLDWLQKLENRIVSK